MEHAQMLEMLNTFRKAQDTFKSGMMSMIIGEIQRKKDNETVDVIINRIRGDIANRIEKQYNKYDYDLAVTEMEFMNSVFPQKQLKKLSDDEYRNAVQLVIDDIIEKRGGVSMRDMKAIMSHVQEKFAVEEIEYNGAMISGIVRSIIACRVQRAPERRVFKIDTGDMSPAEAMSYVEQFKK